jgi:uncharacterized membrane protein
MPNLFYKTFWKTYRMVIVILFVLTTFASQGIAQDFTINKFASDITIDEDSSFIVRETIVVKFHTLKHGIYREIPFKYIDDRGNTVKTPLTVMSVTDVSGKDWKYKETKKGNVINIRIGDPRKFVEGIQTYVITYMVENAILFFDDHDELYWNVTGNYWWSTIQEASAHVALKVKNKSHDLWAACYTGAFGSGQSECRYETSHNIADFITQKSLRPREGLTVAFGWDKGLISPPSAWKKVFWVLDIRDNWILILPFFSLVFMLNLWRTRGRDPKVREAVTVTYEPPKYNNVPLTPGEVGTLVDEKLDPRDITSTIVGLAVKGYIKIEESKKEGLIFDSTDYYLAKVKDPDDNLSPFEKILMTSIYTAGLPGVMVSDMKNSFYAKIDLLKSTLYEELVSKNYFLTNPDKVRKYYITAGIIVGLTAVFTLNLFTASTVWKCITIGLLCSLPVFAFSRVMPAKTKTGASAYMDILGFQEFMNRAEKDQLERMGDKNLFSRLLPYAIALNVVDNWARAFEGIYQETPQWYASHGGFGTFSPHNFSHSISSATSSLASAMYSAPRGSGISGGGGFSGGGFSGGGFGGGGGGSW